MKAVSHKPLNMVFLEKLTFTYTRRTQPLCDSPSCSTSQSPWRTQSRLTLIRVTLKRNLKFLSETIRTTCKNRRIFLLLNKAHACTRVEQKYWKHYPRCNNINISVVQVCQTLSSFSQCPKNHLPSDRLSQKDHYEFNLFSPLHSLALAEFPYELPVERKQMHLGLFDRKPS